MSRYVSCWVAALCAATGVVGFAERSWGEAPTAATPSATAAASPSATPSASASRPRRAAQERRRAKALAAPESTKDAVGISFEQLEFEFAKGAEYKLESLPEPVRKLLNKKVRLRGFMWPDVPYEKGNKAFILVRDDKSSSTFVTNSELCEHIIVKMQEGKTVDFTIRPVTLEGVLTFRVERDLPDEPPLSVLHIVAESVESPTPTKN
jgi:hypothetical protein